MKMDFINCGDILETKMTVDDDNYVDVKVKLEDTTEAVSLPEHVVAQPSTTQVDQIVEVKPEKSSRRTRKALSLRNARKPKQPKPRCEPTKIFWCFGVPRYASCELCFGVCIPLRCRKCKVVRNKSGIIVSFDCAECGKSFKDIPEFKEHMKAEHVDLKCKDCGKCFPNKVRLKAHSTIHKERKYLCELCSFAFQRLDQYKSHYKRKHTDSKDFLCRECGKAWKTKGDLTQHMRVHDDRYRPIKQNVS